MPFVQGKFSEDFRGVQYGDNVQGVLDITFHSRESATSALDMKFPPVESAPAGILDLTFPDTDTGGVKQPTVLDRERPVKGKSAGVVSRIRGWFR